MKTALALTLTLFFSTTGFAEGFFDFLGFGKKGDAPTAQNAVVALGALSQTEVAGGLKEALGSGIQRAVGLLGQNGGFLTNKSIKIQFPEKIKSVETTLRSLNQGPLADEFVATMNHAAEQAMPAAAPIFAEALKGMTIEDAKAILSSSNNAATAYFRKTTEAKLSEKFLPIVKTATDKVGVTAAYKKLMAKVTPSTGSLGGFGNSLLKAVNFENVDVDSYVTGMAMDGLFKSIAEEEKSIRENPVARTTDTLKRVFGAIPKK